MTHGQVRAAALGALAVFLSCCALSARALALEETPVEIERVDLSPAYQRKPRQWSVGGSDSSSTARTPFLASEAGPAGERAATSGSAADSAPEGAGAVGGTTSFVSFFVSLWTSRTRGASGCSSERKSSTGSTSPPAAEGGGVGRSDADASAG